MLTHSTINMKSTEILWSNIGIYKYIFDYNNYQVSKSI